MKVFISFHMNNVICGLWGSRNSLLRRAPPCYSREVPGTYNEYHFQNWPENTQFISGPHYSFQIYFKGYTDFSWKKTKNFLNTLRKDQRVFSNSFSAATIFPWQKSTKLPVLRVACSCSERFKNSVSVTTWLIWTTCELGCWGCWGFGFVFSKDTSFPPNWGEKKRPIALKCFR